MLSYYLHLGSNEGDRLDYLTKAIEMISKSIGKVTDTSSIYETEAWGKKDQDAFLNQALKLSTDKEAFETLFLLQKIEKDLGQGEKEKWGPRKIDIDMLYCGETIIKDGELTLPHPHLYERNFVLIPLMEIAGDFIDPIKNISVEEIFDLCKDDSEVIFFE